MFSVAAVAVAFAVICYGGDEKIPLWAAVSVVLERFYQFNNIKHPFVSKLPPFHIRCHCHYTASSLQQHG